MHKLLMHSLVCLLGIGFFVEVISNGKTPSLSSYSSQHFAALADEDKFFCEDFDSLRVGQAIADTSDRWLAHPIDSLNAKLVVGPTDSDIVLALDSARVATLDLSEVSLLTDNQFHLEWMLDFQKASIDFDTIFFSENASVFDQAIAIAVRQDSLKFLSGQTVVAAHSWGPDPGDNLFEVFVNTRIDSAFFVVNDEAMATIGYPFAQLGHVVFNSRNNSYYLDDVCHSVQVPEENCACGVDDWRQIYCNTFEDYFLGPFLANATPEWRMYNGPDNSGILMQEEGLNQVLIQNQDSIGLILPSGDLTSKFVFSFQALLRSSPTALGGGGVRLYLDSARTKEIFNLRFRKNGSNTESVELTIDQRQLPSYNEQTFKFEALSDFNFVVDTTSWNFNFFHDGDLKFTWAVPDSVTTNAVAHNLTAVFYGRPGEFYKLDDICIQEPPTRTSCNLSSSWEAVFCDNFDTHSLGRIETISMKWAVQNPLVEKAEIVVPDQIEDYNPRLMLPVGSKTRISISLNQLNTNRFRINSLSRVSNPLQNFGGSIFLGNATDTLIEVRMNDGFGIKAGVVSIYGTTTETVDIPIVTSTVDEYDFSFLFDQTNEKLEIFFKNQLLISSPAADSLLIRDFLNSQDLLMEYAAKVQPMIVDQLAVYRRLANTDECSEILTPSDTCMVAIGDSLYTPGEACLLGYLQPEWVTFEDPIVVGLKENIRTQIEALDGRVEDNKIIVDQARVQELFFILDNNSLALANNLCASYASIRFLYRGDPVTSASCSGESFAWDFLSNGGGLISTFVMDLEIESCIKIDSILGIDTFSVAVGMLKFGSFGLVVEPNESLDFGFPEMDEAVNNLKFDLDMVACNDNITENYTFGPRVRLVGANGKDSCFQYVGKVEAVDNVCGFVVPASDSVFINIYDTLAPTIPPLDTMHFACLADAFAAAHASTIDTSLVVDNIQGNEDTSQITSQVYLSVNPQFLEVTKEWSLADSCGNVGKTFQRFIVSEEPISFTTPDTAYIDRLTQLSDISLTGELKDISSLCGPISDTTFVDNKTIITACRDTVVRTWTVTDSIGNQRSYPQVIIYEDTVNPEIEDLPKVTFNRLSDTTNFIIVGIPKLLRDDHPLVDTSYTDVISDSSLCFARINRTWRLSDSCGNTTISEQELVFDARMDPLIEGLKPEIQQAINEAGGTVIGNTISTSQRDITAIYNLLNDTSLLVSNADCSNHVEVDFTYEGTVIPSDTSCTANDFVWNFIDENGNVTASYALVVEIFSCIEFNEAGNIIPGSIRPGLSYMNDTTLAAQLINGASISLADMDSLVGSLQFNIDFVSCNDNARVRYTSQVRTRTTVTGSDAACFNYAFVAEVYDEKCGFVESKPISINVVDTIAPTYPTLDTLDFPCIGDAYLAAIPSILDLSLIEDNLRGNEDLSGITDTIYENSNFPFAAVTKRWTISDLCGNSRDIYQHFLVNQEPISLELPDTILIAEFSQLQDTSFTKTITNVFSFCGEIDAITFEDDKTSIGPCEEFITRTWTVTDDRGNKRVANQIFLYKDTLGPVLESFDIQRLSCVEDAEDLAKSGLPVLISDDHPILSFTFTDQVFDSIACLKQIIRTWEVADPCGNVTEQEQIIEIDNRNLPNIVWPPALVRINCRPELEDTTLTGRPFFAEAECNGTQISYVDEVVSASPCEQLYQRTWTVQTLCGLEVSNNQVIQVKDSIPPTFVAPEPVIVVITDLPRLGVTGFPTNIEDNCFVSNSIEFEDEWVKEPTCSETGLVRRKLTVLDECENGQTVDQLITVLPLSTPIEVSIEIDTIRVPMDTSFIQLPKGFPDSGMYSGPFVFDNLFSVQEAGPGTYEVLYSIGDLASGCAFSDTVTIIVEGVNANVDHAFLSALSIFPNPTSSEVTINFEGVRPELIRIKLWTSRGALIQQEQIQIPSANWNHNLSLADLPSGLYWISFEGPDGFKGHRKVVKY